MMSKLYSLVFCLSFPYLLTALADPTEEMLEPEDLHHIDYLYKKFARHCTLPSKINQNGSRTLPSNFK